MAEALMFEPPRGHYDYDDDDFPGYVKVRERQKSLEFRCGCGFKGRILKDGPDWRDDFLPDRRTITVKCNDCAKLFEVYRCECWLALEWKDNRIAARSPAVLMTGEVPIEKIKFVEVNEDAE